MDLEQVLAFFAEEWGVRCRLCRSKKNMPKPVTNVNGCLLKSSRFEMVNREV